MLCKSLGSTPTQFRTCRAQPLGRSFVAQKASYWLHCIVFAARVISGRRKLDHVWDVRDELGWLDSSQLFHYQSLSLLHKIISTGEPECIANQSFTDRDNPRHICSTRQYHLLHIPTIRTEVGRRRFLFKALRQFNELPAGIRALKGA